MDARELLSEVFASKLDNVTFDQNIYVEGETEDIPYIFDYHVLSENDVATVSSHAKCELLCANVPMGHEYYQQGDECYARNEENDWVLVDNPEQISAVLFVLPCTDIDKYKDLSVEEKEGKYIFTGQITYNDLVGFEVAGGDILHDVKIVADMSTKLLEHVHVELRSGAFMQNHHVEKFRLDTAVSKIGQTVITMPKVVTA